MPVLRADQDIVIVGAGFAGAATAFHLAETRRRRVLILEQEDVPGVHSSGRNAAIVREHADDPSWETYVTQGAEELRLGRLAEFNRCGVMLVSMGADVVSEYFPAASGRGRWCPDDGTVDAAGLLRTYLGRSEVSYGTKVSAWTANRGKVRVQTNRGELVCNLLVNAAGPWAGDLGNLDLVPMNRHLFVTPPLKWVKPEWPIVWDGQTRLYFRPESGGLLLCSCDETPAAPGDYREDPRIVEQLATKLSAAQLGLGDLSIQSMWVGQRVFARDRKCVVGYDPRCEQVFHVAGLGGHGVTASFAIGRLAAELIERGPTGPAHPFSPARLLNDRELHYEAASAHKG